MLLRDSHPILYVFSLFVYNSHETLALLMCFNFMFFIVKMKSF